MNNTAIEKPIIEKKLNRPNKVSFFIETFLFLKTANPAIPLAKQDITVKKIRPKINN